MVENHWQVSGICTKGVLQLVGHLRWNRADYWAELLSWAELAPAGL